MTEYQLMTVYLETLFGRVFDRVRTDERGAGTAEYLVLTLFGLAIAAAIAGVLWAKLRTGANNTDVPQPQAP